MGGVPAWLEAPPPILDARQAIALAESLYALRAVSAQPLYAERDANFLLTGTGGQRHILKVANADADPAQLAMQARALRHALAADPSLPLPRLLPTCSGGDMAAWTDATGSTHCVRLLDWVPGEHLELHRAPAAARRDAGRVQARLTQALRGCPGDGAATSLPWDLANTAALRPLLTVLADADLRALAADRLDAFEAWIASALAALPRQLVHNDLNPENLLFAPPARPRVTGVLDFGDMVQAAPVCDLAVAATYHLPLKGDPLRALAPLLAGYREVRELDDAERALLLPLLECRLVATLLIQGSRTPGQAPFTTAALRPSALEAARRLQHLSARARGWNRDALDAMLR